MVKIDFTKFFDEYVVFGWYLDDRRYDPDPAEWEKHWQWTRRRFHKATPWHKCWKWND